MSGKPNRKGIVYAIKRVYWDLQIRSTRFIYLQFFLCNIPGYLGLLWRRKLYMRYCKRVGKNLTVYQGVRIRNVQEMEIGDDVHIGLDVTLQAAGGIVIGDRVAFGPGSKIWTSNHRFENLDAPIMEQGYDYKPVTIGNDVWIAANVFIMPGVHIPEGTVVSAGAVVGVKKYPPYSIISGNPARVIGNRLKNEEKKKAGNSHSESSD